MSFDQMVEMLVDRNELAPAPEFNEAADRTETDFADLADHPDKSRWYATGSRNAAFQISFSKGPSSQREVSI